LVCRYIKELHVIITRCLDGENVVVVLYEFGKRTLQYVLSIECFANLRLFNSSTRNRIILRHIRKYTIDTQHGMLVLVSDLTQYQQAFSRFSIRRLDEEFEILRPIGKLFMVAPEQLRDVIKDSPLEKLPQRELESFIKRRSDYSSSWIGKHF